MAGLLHRIFGNGSASIPVPVARNNADARGRKSSPEITARNAEIISQWKTGERADTLAQKYNVSTMTIYSIVKGVERSSKIRKKARRSKLQVAWDAASTATLLNLWFNGSSAQQCADILGRSYTRSAVLGKLHRMRVAGELKPPGQNSEAA